MGAPGSRRKAREATLQVLFAVDLSGTLEIDSVDRAFEMVTAEFSLPRAARLRAREMARGVAQDLKRIDEFITRACIHWKIHRLASVDRNILRLAVYELLVEPETPTEVVIDEAVEIARRFSAESSPAFVNGVLDMIARQRTWQET